MQENLNQPNRLVMTDTTFSCCRQALLQAKWPPELEDNPSFCTKVYGEDRQLVPAQLATVRVLQLS